MKKEEIREAIKEQVKEIRAEIVRVYGVVTGVGYDLNVDFITKNGSKIRMPFHASPKTWEGVGHMRPYQYDFVKYTGKKMINIEMKS